MAWKSQQKVGRVIFVPCNSIGIPKDRPGLSGGEERRQSNDYFNLIAETAINISNRGLGAAALKFLAGGLFKNGMYGMRSSIVLHVNPYMAQFDWTTESKQSGGAAKGASQTESANEKVQGTAPPEGIIMLQGYSGWQLGGTFGGAYDMSPEIEVTQLKNIFGVWEPLKADARGASLMYGGGNDISNISAGAPPSDPSMYLWDMWYFVPDEENRPMRYFGYAESLSIGQSGSGDANFKEFQWELKFTVLQRRESLQKGGSVGP